jgi:hypothetical protein
MRAKKALKQLSKAEALISTVANRYTPSDPQLQELLGSASATLGRAKSVLDNRPGQSGRTSTQATKKRSPPQGPETPATPEFTGNKIDFVRAVVEARGPSGAMPRDIDEAFTTRRIDRSKNLIYNSLSALVKQKKLKKKGDRYLSASIDSNVKSVLPKKRISPEGLKRIIEANKRRWAGKKAAQDGRAATGLKKSSVGKRSAVARSTGRKVSAKRAVAKPRVRPELS